VFAGWRWWPLAAVNRRAIVSLREGDHMKLTRAPGQPLGDAVRDAACRKDSPRRRLKALDSQLWRAIWPLCVHLLHYPQVRDAVEAATGARPAGRITLLTHPRYFGYCFNPVSFYYVWAADGSGGLESVLAEVSNTPW
jgi:hypothetical protein